MVHFSAEKLIYGTILENIVRRTGGLSVGWRQRSEIYCVIM